MIIMNKKIIVTTLIIMGVLLGGCNNGQVKQEPLSKENKNQDISNTSETKNNTIEPIQQSQDNKPEIKSEAKSNSSEEDKQSKEIFWGQWVIKKQLAYGHVRTFSSDDIKCMIGKKLSFSKEKASCFGEQVSDLNNMVDNPIYKKSVVSKSDFESGTRNYVTFDKLGIKSNSITEVNVNDSKGKGCLFYIKDNNSLILYGGGVYFQLDRM